MVVVKYMQYFFVYILKCNDGSYYTGHTDDLEKRLAEHQSGIFKGYTALRLPTRLVFSECFESRDEAFYVEQQIKGWSRRKKEALIEGNFELLIKYSQCSANSK